MPQIENPEAFAVFCLPLRDILAAGEIRDVTEEEARATADSSVFRVHGLDPDADAAAAAAAKEAEDAAAKEAEAQRVAVQRGSTVVETTAAPPSETR